MYTTVQTTNDTHALELELDQLQQSYNWISDSFAFTGHELRNGLLRLRLVVDKLQREGSTNIDHQQTVTRIAACSQMLELIALNCIRLAQVDDPRFAVVPKPVDAASEIINPLLVEYADMLAMNQIECGVEIDDAATTLWADAGLLKLAISNLLNNAIKYGEPNSVIFINIQPNKRFTEISVWNSGNGISSVMLSRIFERFEVGSDRHAATSSGIGLYLVKRIIEAHSGSVACESQLGQWARFNLLIPQKSNELSLD
jgi:signal transduction histidine kinase